MPPWHNFYLGFVLLSQKKAENTKSNPLQVFHQVKKQTCLKKAKPKVLTTYQCMTQNMLQGEKRKKKTNKTNNKSLHFWFSHLQKLPITNKEL